MKSLIAAAAVLCLLSFPAQAKQCVKFLPSGAHAIVKCIDYAEAKRAKRPFQADRNGLSDRSRGLRRTPAEILPHPAGCPPRRFCGCGVALRVFGAPIRSLWLAENWLRFPRAEPAPGMVAARKGHVFLIERVIDRRTVIAYDPNSGKGQTRRHVRSLAGFSVRDPRT